MEKWQRDHIRENFPELIHVTVTNVVLLAHLQASGVLSRDDVETIQGRSGSLDRAVKLYEIVQARTAAYGKLLEALRSCNQSGAANILQKGFQKYVSAHPDYKTTPLSTSSGSGEDESQPRFVKPVEGLLSYISEASEKRLILLSTPDPDLTLSKMDDTLIGIDVSVQTLSRWDIKSRWLKLKKSRQPANNGENVPVKVILNDSGNNKKSPITIDKYFKSFKHLDLSDYTRFVAVLPEKKEVLEQLKEKCMSNKILADKVAVLNDTFRWDHLSKTTQSKILKQTVIDQGRQVKLETVCRSYVYEDKKLFRSTLIKDKLLIDLLHYKEPPVIFRQTIPPVMEHYIRRRFRCRHRISNEVFKRATGNEIFVISGPGNLEELKRMAQGCKWKIDMASSQLRKNTSAAHFILLESENQFQKLCAKFHHTHGVHLLKAEGGQLIWEKTEGDKMGDLQASVFEASGQMQFGEDATYDMLKIRNESEPFIICDAPGMGKTILLASLANKTRQRAPKESVVLFFVMTDFLTSVKMKFRDTNHAPKLDDVLKEEISSFASSYDLQNGTILASTKSRISLFFDGLDEVPIDALDLAFQCFERIRVIFPSSRIHVSTRPHLLNQVERAFRTLGYNIQPFNEHDQTSFLTQYWSNYWVVNELRYNDEALIEYTKSCLTTLKAKLSKNETDIAGIPLQCLLIGEVFEEEAMSYGDPENKRTAKDVTPTIHINSISELYDRMIERKFVSFERRCLSEASLPLLKTPLTRLHVYLSIQTIFPDSDWATNMHQTIFTQNIVCGLKMMLPDWLDTSFDFYDGGALRNCIVRIGMLIGVDDGRLQFLHRTIAEHFLATYSTDFLTQNPAHPTQQIIHDFIDQKILETDSQSTVISQAYNMSQTEYTFKLPVVCSFINSIISGIPDIYANSSSVVHRSVNKENIMRACIHDDHESILKLYFIHHKPECEGLLKTMLRSATRHSSTEIFDQLGYKPEMYDGDAPTLLHIAMERGSHPMETHLRTQYHFLALMQQRNLPDWESLVKACVVNTKDAENDLVDEKLKILTSLDEDYPGLISESIQRSSLTTWFSSVHIKLLLELLRHIETHDDLTAGNENGNSIIQSAAEHFSVEHYCHFLTEIKKKFHGKLTLYCIYSADKTSLRCVVRQMHPQHQMMHIFPRNRITARHTNDVGYSPLGSAVAQNEPVESLQKMLNSSGSDAMKVDKFGRSLLHIAAQHCHGSSVLEMLVQNGLEVNLADCFGNTPIFYALRNTKSDDIIWYLLDHDVGGDIGHQNHKGETILHWAAERGNICVLQGIIHLYPYDSSPLDTAGNNPLHLALRASMGEKMETVKCLQKRFPSDVNMKNMYGQCPLMYGVTRRHPDITLEVIEFLQPFIETWTEDLVNATLSIINKQSDIAIGGYPTRYTNLLRKIKESI